MTLVTEATLIALREGLEALLITGILLGLVTRLGHPEARKHVWAGFAAAVLTSVLAGLAIQRYLLNAFEEQGWGAMFELLAALLAIVTLLYMVFWMWSHTTKVLAETKKRVQTALTTGSLATVVFITYISTLREGLETVLFYSALTGQAATRNILWSGALGFLGSAILVYLLLRTSHRISVKSFFTVTGLWLIIVAAMLSTHVVAAATELGWLSPAPAIWDTSSFIADGSPAGRILHATVGYSAAPTLVQAISYFGILLGAGGVYLYKQGIFTQATEHGPIPRYRRVVPALAGVVLIAALVAGAAANPTGRIMEGHDHGEEEDHLSPLATKAHVGVILRDHGEPVHYNASTYESFKSFYRALLENAGYGELLEIDQGTVLLDEERPFQEDPRVDPNLVDAWLEPHDGPAVWTGSPVDEEEVPVFEGFYQAPAGPGLGEPDVLEAMGLSTYQAYLQMENDSPMYHDKTALLDRVEGTLENAIEADLTIERAHHVRPMLDPEAESLDASVKRLVDSDVDVIVDAYTSALHSDVMNTCMKQEALHEALAAHGYDGPVLEAGPYGLGASFAEDIATYVADRLDAYPPEAHVWVSLTHHGMDPSAQSPCKDRPDPYVEQTKVMHENVAAALEEKDVAVNTTVAMVYGQGAEEHDAILSPTQALNAADEAGATHVLDVPYELPGNGYDNLVRHRSNYDLDPENAPHYDANYETNLVRHGIDITITRSDVAHEGRAQSQTQAILDALAPWVQEQEASE